jgi:hypothetical protein
MTFFAGGSLVISLPAAEIAPLDLPGSVMTPDQALALPVSRTLACALRLIETHCQARGVRTRYLARPEIFTHGSSAAWLRERLGDVAHHLCITDASTVKHVEGCRTHIFLYRLAHNDSYASFARLCRRAPALLGPVASQVNTRFAWGTAPHRHLPVPVYLRALQPPPPPPVLLYPFQFTPYLTEETAARILHAKALALDGLPPAAHTRYLPLTETSLQDTEFAGAAARLIRAAFVHPATNLILRLPNERPGETLAARIAATLTALAATGIILPRNTPANIFFATGDLPGDPALPGLSIVLHESFEFWRHTDAFYQAAQSVMVAASTATLPDPEFLPLDVTPIYGARAKRLWLKPVAGARP